MPKRIPPLTDSCIKNAQCPQVKPDLKLRDPHGLYVLLTVAGTKLWRLDYRRPVTRTKNTLSLGEYPAVKLSAARKLREAAEELIAQGIDPADRRKDIAAAAASTLQAVGEEWLAKKNPEWVPAHFKRSAAALRNDVFPYIGRKPVDSVTSREILEVVKRTEQRSTETAHRELNHIGQIVRYAIATGRAETDPTAHMHEALKPIKNGHFPAVTDPDELAVLLRTLDTLTDCTPQVRAALPPEFAAFIGHRLRDVAEVADRQQRGGRLTKIDADAMVHAVLGKTNEGAQARGSMSLPEFMHSAFGKFMIDEMHGKGMKYTEIDAAIAKDWHVATSTVTRYRLRG